MPLESSRGPCHQNIAGEEAGLKELRDLRDLLSGTGDFQSTKPMHRLMNEDVRLLSTEREMHNVYSRAYAPNGRGDRYESRCHPSLNFSYVDIPAEVPIPIPISNDFVPDINTFQYFGAPPLDGIIPNLPNEYLSSEVPLVYTIADRYDYPPLPPMLTDTSTPVLIDGIAVCDEVVAYANNIFQPTIDTRRFSGNNSSTINGGVNFHLNASGGFGISLLSL